MYYFAYGMNTNFSSMRMSCPNAKFISTGTLKDYKLSFKFHCDVESFSDEQVVGGVWNITPDCLLSLDSIEGFPNYYDRITVPIQTAEGAVDAICYTMQQGNFIEVPNDRYYSMVTKGYSDCGIPIEQLKQAMLEATIARDL